MSGKGNSLGKGEGLKLNGIICAKHEVQYRSIQHTVSTVFMKIVMLTSRCRGNGIRSRD